MAEEFKANNTPQVQQTFADSRGKIPTTYLPHDEFKLRVPQTIGLIRTSDTTQYANMILESA
jgi:D-ribose pyranase